MGEKKPGDSVNIECDVLARYLYNMIKVKPLIDNKETITGDTLIGKLERMGF
jgi:riboflavin synthase alpha subunit